MDLDEETDRLLADLKKTPVQDHAGLYERFLEDLKQQYEK
jgi:hypothetical protein